MFPDGDEWKVEFQAIPKGEIRYTTDGSNPKDHGGIYDSPFAVPASSRFVLAYAKSDNIVSEVERIDTEQYRKQEGIIDIIKPDLPATWNCKKRGLTARAAFEFIDRLDKYQGNAYGVSLQVQANDDSGEVSYDSAPNCGLNAATLTELVQHLQSTFKNECGSQIFIDIDKVTLERGQLLKDWFAAMKYQPKPGEVQ